MFLSPLTALRAASRATATGLLLAGLCVLPSQLLAQATHTPPTTRPTAPRLLRAGDVDTMPLTRPSTRIAYGSDSLQFGDLRLPDGRGPFPVAIVIHGGCWLSRYASVQNSSPLADALAAAGIATWNVEYRRYDHPGGGWPGTFRDIADGADHLRALAARFPLDTNRVVVAGHSAGGHLALWLATRKTLDATSPLAGGIPMTFRGIVSVGGIADLREFYGRQRNTCGNPAVESLLGGVPDSVPTRLRDASPIERLPLGIPSVHIAGERDFIAPLAVREAFVQAARARGDSARTETIPLDGHFEAITPKATSGQAVIAAIKTLLAPRR